VSLRAATQNVDNRNSYPPFRAELSTARGQNYSPHARNEEYLQLGSPPDPGCELARRARLQRQPKLGRDPRQLHPVLGAQLFADRRLVVGHGFLGQAQLLANPLDGIAPGEEP
jgi:hypothetical protein